jgi:stage III sporulation protein AE
LSEVAAFGIAKNIRGAFLWGMGALCALFSGVLGLQSILMGAKDSMTIRTARYAISNMIPIVGSSVSGALSTLGGALSYVKDTLGIGTVAVLLSLLLPTLITLLLHRLILSLGSGIVKLISGQDKNAFSVFLVAFDTLIASYAFSSLIYIIETVIFIKSGVAIL